MTARSNIHRGKILHAVASRHQKSVVSISKDAGYDKSTFYVHIKREELSFDILYKYGKSMGYDFSSDIPEMNQYLSANGLNKANSTALSYDELSKDRDSWKDKYYALLEENNRLIKEKYNQQ